MSLASIITLHVPELLLTIAGYYAIGPAVTLAVICAPQEPSKKPLVQDLAPANLRLKRDRIAHLRRLINLTPYIYSLLQLIGHHGSPEFTLIERYVLLVVLLSPLWSWSLYRREGKYVEIGMRSIKKTYRGDFGQERVRIIKNIYGQLKEKGVPHVDTLTFADGPVIYLEPRGIDIKPSNEKELLQAVICVLKTLQVCTIIHALACQFTSYLRFFIHHQRYIIETSGGLMFFDGLMIPISGF